jgi:hypothetical protein
VRADCTRPPDQIIDCPAVSNDSRYRFSLFAFVEAQFPATITVFCKFIRDYYDQHGYQSNSATALRRTSSLSCSVRMMDRS